MRASASSSSTRVVSDNRIPALGSGASESVFNVPAAAQLRIEMRLIYRRAFIKLMDQKGRDVPDILIESGLIELLGA